MEAQATGATLKRYRFNVEEYHRMAAAGILHEDDRVELIDGEIVEMAAIGSRHALCVARLTRIFLQRFGERAVVWPQNPLRIDSYTEVQPDLCLLRPPEGRYADRPPAPEDALLVVEVADTTVATDRRHKLPLYARAGIREAWLVDLVAGRLEVHLAAEPESRSSDRPSDLAEDRAYPEVRRMQGGSVTPRAFEDMASAEIRIADFLD